MHHTLPPRPAAPGTGHRGRRPAAAAVTAAVLAAALTAPLAAARPASASGPASPTALFTASPTASPPVFSTATPAATPAASPAKETATGRYGRARLQRDVDAIRALGATGVEAQVVTGDGRRLVATAGVADLRTGQPVPAGGYTRVSSVTKMFVATVMLQLAGEGRLSLDDTVERWLPGVVRGNGHDGRRITIRRLLQHTAGVYDAYPAFASVEDYRERRYDRFTDEQVVAEAMRHEPAFRPGEDWLYSNTGYLIISMIIKKVTGRPWHAEVRDRISRPLGLRHTRWSGTSLDVPRPRMKGYLVPGPGRAPVDVTRHFDGDAAGGLISTAPDVNRFLRALAGGRLLSPALLEEMRRTVPATAFQQVWPGARYGLGIMSRPLTCGGLYWNHGGDDYGYTARTGVTADGRRSVTLFVAGRTADGERMQAREKAAAELVDRALCGGR
ncbi:beta-lactamase family protein [Planomonospora sp. ID91781]|uniref:serine hydrolase domain-containing protein n=1 Tax=Planomonospora sp. ID91781 TaxID=2738135 RepID=UPI0018C43CA4|nr:serine hydrolase domain-containing protein [Planomonospora sp. ID91781]MBG0822495.1 beta-lactamase family protein [Planomonospora sp. ID91781]